MKATFPQASISLLIILIFFVGCKSNEPIIQSTNDDAIEKVEVIEESEVISENKPDGLQEGDIMDSENLREYSGSHRLGDIKVVLKFWKKGSGLTFVNLHDNENTSVKAALVLLDSIGGRLIELSHSGDRNIQFSLKSKQYEFDPNRMFTDLGARSSLIKYSRTSTKAHKLIRGLAQRVVDSLDRKMIVTLHNNSDANYSSLSYLDEYKSDAADVFINPKLDPDDFYFVTTRELFEKFKALGYNTVLQNNATMTDDGSLSVLAGRQVIPYINVEAQHGHLDMQIAMLFDLVNALEELQDQ